MMDLSHVITSFKQESVTITRKGRTYNPDSLTGYDDASGTPETLQATIVQSQGRRNQMSEKTVYGEIALHFYFPGIVSIEENDSITRAADGLSYEVKEYFFREQGNYTHIVAVRNRQQGDETPV